MPHLPDGCFAREQQLQIGAYEVQAPLLHIPGLPRSVQVASCRFLARALEQHQAVVVDHLAHQVKRAQVRRAEHAGVECVLANQAEQVDKEFLQFALDLGHRRAMLEGRRLGQLRQLEVELTQNPAPQYGVVTFVVVTLTTREFGDTYRHSSGRCSTDSPESSMFTRRSARPTARAGTPCRST
ncbi:hypothetical protein D3C76_603080 [compost metagenome]